MAKEIEDTAHEEEENLEEEIEEKEEEDVNEAGQSDEEVQDEIGKLLEIIGEESPKTEEEESSEEEEQASEEEEETEETEDEEEEKPEEEEGEPEEESKDEPDEEGESEEEEPPEEKESSDELVNRLRGEINTLSKELMSKPEVTPAQKEPGDTVSKEPLEVISTDITQEEYDEAMTDKDKFSKLIDKVVAVRTQQELSNVAQSVDGVIAEKLSLNQRVNDFFDEHENLRGVRDYVGHLAQSLSVENKDWNMDKIFKELPEVAYKNLGLSADSTTTNRDNGSKSKSKRKTKSKSQRPAFTKGSKSRASADNLTQEQKDISQTLEL